MFILGYFFITFFIFILFSILLFLLGYFIQYYSFSSFRTRKIDLSTFLESFGIGTVIFIAYSYLIIDFFRFFNFLSMYLPLLVFDSLNMIIICYKKRNGLKHEIIEKFKEIRDYALSNKGKNKCMILIVVFLLVFIVMGVIITDLSYPARDTFIWASNVMYLCKYGDFYYEFITVHTAGFVIFSAGALLISPDFYVMFFFLKFLPLFLFFITILAYYRLFAFIFKKDIEIAISLVSTLSFNYFLYRSILPLPSILVSALFAILISTFTEKENLRLLIVRGLLLGGIFLTHILYAPIFIMFYLFFEVLNLISEKKQNKTTKSLSFFKLFVGYSKKNIILFLPFIAIIIPYFLNGFINGYNFFSYYSAYIDTEPYLSTQTNETYNSIIIQPYNIILTAYTPSHTNIFYNLYFFGISFILTKTLNWGIIFLILGIFYKNKKITDQKKYLIEFINLTFIITCIIFIMSSLLLIAGKGIIFTLADFVIHYGGRIFELFSGLWSILIVLGMKRIFKYVNQKKTNENINTNKEKSKNSIEKSDYSSKKRKKAYFIVLLIVGASLYSSHLVIQYNFLYTNYYKDDNLTEAVLFISDYIDKENINRATILLPENPTTNFIYKLIYYENIDNVIVEYDDISYSDLLILITNNSANFVLLNKLETKESCLDKINEEMNVLDENSHYIFFEI